MELDINALIEKAVQKSDEALASAEFNYSSRQKSDYDFTYIPNTDEIFTMIQETKYFVSEIKNYLQNK